MMDMNTKFVSDLKSFIDMNMDMNRRSQNKVNFMSYFFVLYAYKVQYPLSFVNLGNIFSPEMVLNDFHEPDGSLLGDLYRMAIKESGDSNYRFQDVAVFFNELTRYYEHIDIYKDVLEYLIEKMAMSSKRLDVEHVQPKEVTDVVCHILKKHQACRIYNPFSGLASYAIGMKDSNQFHSYLGQDSDERTVLLSRLRLDAYNLNHLVSVESADVFHSWGKRKETFDAVVATPPFGQRIREISISLFPNRIHQSKTMEEYTLWSCLDESEGCRVAVIVVPSSFLYRKDTFSLRKTICEKKALEMVIDLPQGIFYGTGISTSILVLNLKEKQDYITFIDAQRAIFGKGRDLRLDKDSVIDMIEGRDSENSVSTHVCNLFDHDCLFSAYLYASEIIKPSDDENVHRLGDLIKETRGERYTGVKPCNTLSVEDFSTDFFKVIEKEDVTTCRWTDSPIRKIHGPHLVLANIDGKVALYMHKGDTDFYVKERHIAVKVNTQLVTPEYMAYMLLTSAWAKKISSFNMGINVGVTNFVRLSSVQVSILDKNKQIPFIENICQEENEKQTQILKAELARRGFRDVYSDVIHMLGTPFHKQAQVIKRLKKTNKDDEKYAQRVRALIDISLHIQRIIDMVGDDFISKTPSLDFVDLSDFLSEYFMAWNNYASGIYRMQIEVATDGIQMGIHANSDWLMVLMDTLTDNAKRHGFGSDYDPNNLVNLSLQHVKYNGIPCVLLSVSNNGNPLDEGFSIHDYITRGRFSGSSGRTGLGGNHVYTIVKKHGGWLNIRSDKSWNFIVDILFPMANSINEDFNDYDYEAL